MYVQCQYFSIATIGLQYGILFACNAHTMESLLAQQYHIYLLCVRMEQNFVSYRILSPALCMQMDKIKIFLQPKKIQQENEVHSAQHQLRISCRQCERDELFFFASLKKKKTRENLFQTVLRAMTQAIVSRFNI